MIHLSINEETNSMTHIKRFVLLFCICIFIIIHIFIYFQKLLWAVAEALRSKGIGMSHPRFKQYASNLARTIKKYMPDLENKNIPRRPGSTSDRMLRLAKHHVLLIIDATPTD